MEQKLIYPLGQEVKLIKFNVINPEEAASAMFDLIYKEYKYRNRYPLPYSFDWEDFIKHFETEIDQSPPDMYIPLEGPSSKISWITYLFEQLSDKQIITSMQPWKLICDHFAVYSFGEVSFYKASSLAVHSNRRKKRVTNEVYHETDEYITYLEGINEGVPQKQAELDQLAKEMKKMDKK